MELRYCILQKRYLKATPQQGYQKLVNRLSLMLLEYPPIGRKFKRTARHRRYIVCLTQQILADILRNDTKIQTEIQWIEKFTDNSYLRQALLFAVLEEYCGRMIEDQPFLLHHLRTLCPSLHSTAKWTYDGDLFTIPCAA